jgi:hypothetical protein
MYNKHKELLEPGNISKIQHMVLTLSIGLLLWGIDTTLARSPVLQKEEFRSLTSAMTVVKTLPK